MARPKQKEWSLTTNEYRIGVAFLFAAVIALLTYLGSGIIDGQNEIRAEVQEGNANLQTMRAQVDALRTDITRLDTGQKGEATRLESLIREQDSRLSRANERSVDQANQITRIETRMEAMLGNISKK